MCGVTIGVDNKSELRETCAGDNGNLGPQGSKIEIKQKGDEEPKSMPRPLLEEVLK